MQTTNVDYRRPKQTDPRSVYFQYYTFKNHELNIYYDMFFSMLEHSGKKPKLLDVGCNIGNLLIHCSKDSVGMDIDKWALKVSKKRGLNVKYHDANKSFPLPSNSFDAVNCRQNLEHLDKPIEALKEMYRVLKPGGKLVVTVQNLAYYKWYWWSNPFHKSPFTKMSLGRCVYLAGFNSYTIYDFMNGLFGMRKLYNIGAKPSTIKKIMKFASKFKPVIHVMETYK